MHPQVGSGLGCGVNFALTGDATIAPIAIKVSPRTVSAILDCMRNIELAPVICRGELTIAGLSRRRDRSLNMLRSSVNDRT